MKANLNDIVKQMEDHLVKMALQKGWLAYAKQRSKELEEDESGLFVGITERVREKLKEKQ